MLKSLLGAAWIAVSLLTLAAGASAQDLSGTWLKATVAARVLVDEEPEPTFTLGEGFAPPNFDPKPKRVGIKNTFYIRIDEFDGEQYEASVWVESQQGLIETAEADLQIGPSGIVVGFSFDLKLVKKTKEGVAEIGAIAISTNGRMKLKIKKEELKGVSFTSVGGRAQGEYVEGVESSLVFGAARLKAKSIPEDKVPPLAAG